jgi:hypothetical protein
LEINNVCFNVKNRLSEKASGFVVFAFQIFVDYLKNLTTFEMKYKAISVLENLLKKAHFKLTKDEDLTLY